MDPLFPELPEDLTVLSDEQLEELLVEHNTAAELLDKNDPDFTKDLSPEDEIAQYELGITQIEAIKGEQKTRVAQAKEFEAQKIALAERRQAALADEAEEEVEEEDEEEAKEDLAVEAEAAADAEVEEEAAEEVAEEQKAEEAEPVTASSTQATVRLRRAPAASADRLPAESRAVLTAAGGVEGIRQGSPVSDRLKLAQAYRDTANRYGRVSKHQAGTLQRLLMATATFQFPEERRLHPTDWGYNSEKIAGVVPAGIPGPPGA
jgi:hypothetical protein